MTSENKIWLQSKNEGKSTMSIRAFVHVLRTNILENLSMKNIFF